MNKGETTNIRINMSIQDILESGLYSDRAEGVVINPFGHSLTLNKEILGVIMDHFKVIQDEIIHAGK